MLPFGINLPNFLSLSAKPFAYNTTMQSRLGINEGIGNECLGPRQDPTLAGRIYQNLACMISCDSCTGSTIDSAVCSECSHLFSWDRERERDVLVVVVLLPKSGKIFLPSWHQAIPQDPLPYFCLSLPLELLIWSLIVF